MTKKRQIFIIAICWVAYTLAQLGRYNYSSNVTLVMDKFAVDHAVAGIPSTFFFFAYGIGQILVGMFCHKFNRKILVVSALTLSGIMNFIVFFGAPFVSIKYIWLINGFAQANLWPVIILIIRENVEPERMAAAGIVMSTSSTGGKFAAIGICALFAINTDIFMYCFLAAGILLFTVAALFLFALGDIKKPEKTERNAAVRRQAETKKKTDKHSVILLILLGVFALNCYAISGGLQSWIPSILKESYGLSDAISIFMSVLLPLFTLSVAVISPYLNKKFGNYIVTSLAAFVSGAILIIGVLLFIGVHWLPVIILFTLESIAMGLVANTTTVQVPLTFKGKFDAGFLAGYLNGACYIGMSLNTYVLGAMADSSGWTGALVLLIAIAAFSALLAAIYLIFAKKNKVYAAEEQSAAAH